jgi:excisionase family DNA binding protein
MSEGQDLITVAKAAEELALSPVTIRSAIGRGHIACVRLDGRTNLIPRAEIERYRAEHLGRSGKRAQPPDALTDQQRKQRAYQQAYDQRRKAAREQQRATEPAE